MLLPVYPLRAMEGTLRQLLLINKEHKSLINKNQATRSYFTDLRGGYDPASETEHVQWPSVFTPSVGLFCTTFCIFRIAMKKGS